MAPQLPQITCRATTPLDVTQMGAFRAAFATAEFAPFQQGWREMPSPAFEPARAAAAWSATHLYVLGEMTDRDLFNSVPESEFNHLSIEFGDVFEIFLQPSGQECYFELHVNPNNQKFQLCIPRVGAFQELSQQGKTSAEILEAFAIRPALDSQVEKTADGWHVAVAIPFTLLGLDTAPQSGDSWRFSFSRYDYTRPEVEPDYSSTSPHAAINFHRLQEWGTLHFA